MSQNLCFNYYIIFLIPPIKYIVVADYYDKPTKEGFLFLTGFPIGYVLNNASTLCPLVITITHHYLLISTDKTCYELDLEITIFPTDVGQFFFFIPTY